MNASVHLCMGNFCIVFSKLIKLNKLVRIMAERFTEIVSKLDDNTDTFKHGMETVYRDIDSLKQTVTIDTPHHICVKDSSRLTGSLSAASKRPLNTG